MTTDVKIMLVILAIFIGFLVFIIVNERAKKKRLMEKIKKQWGSISDREYTVAELDEIAHYFRRHQGKKPFVDDITWNDLDMDSIFILLNQTFSSMGEEYLYHMLRTPELDQDVLAERSRLIEFFGSNKAEREQLQMFFGQAGKSKGVSISKYIYRLHDFEAGSNMKHILSAIGLIASIVFAFVYPQVGVFVAIGMIAHNLMLYFKAKGEIEPYFISVTYLIRVIRAAEGMKQVNISEIEEYREEILKAAKEFRGFMRSSHLVTAAGGAAAGGIDAIIMEYLRMLFHVDLIKFNSMVKELRRHIDAAEVILEKMGILESCIAVASFRKMIPIWCEPELKVQKEAFIDSKNAYHPLIAEPVANSVESDRGVLITGSNASGKSTFLKTMAINAILAQSIYTCTATVYKACFFRIYSSMALQDDLMAKESYFIVEIKSLQRILNATEEEMPVLCFVDEVLRGTNTVERISASAQILKSLRKKHVLCFAATHDIELTYLLEKLYKNYHFQEEVIDDDVLFNYQIYEGRAVSRNAIKLLSIIGYSDNIIRKAEYTAANFVETGEWKL